MRDVEVERRGPNQSRDRHRVGGHRESAPVRHSPASSRSNSPRRRCRSSTPTWRAAPMTGCCAHAAHALCATWLTPLKATSVATKPGKPPRRPPASRGSSWRRSRPIPASSSSSSSRRKWWPACRRTSRSHWAVLGGRTLYSTPDSDTTFAPAISFPSLSVIDTPTSLITNSTVSSARIRPGRTPGTEAPGAKIRE